MLILKIQKIIDFEKIEYKKFELCKNLLIVQKTKKEKSRNFDIFREQTRNFISDCVTDLKLSAIIKFSYKHALAQVLLRFEKSFCLVYAESQITAWIKQFQSEYMLNNKDNRLSFL